MNIHPLWFFCIFIRILLIVSVYYSFKQQKFTTFFKLLLSIIGVGFLYKTLFGSNNEIQIEKVFWHETRLVHSILYLLAAYYLFNNYINITLLLLSLDLVFSICYRFINQK